jgi:hypothetical protein
MDSRRRAKIAAIKARLEFCEAERKRLLSAVTSTQVNLAKVYERMERVEKDYYLLSLDLKANEKSDEEDWN